jgi:hypothetical protein
MHSASLLPVSFWDFTFLIFLENTMTDALCEYTTEKQYANISETQKTIQKEKEWNLKKEHYARDHRNALARLETAKMAMAADMQKKPLHLKKLGMEFGNIAKALRAFAFLYNCEAQIEECEDCRKKCEKEYTLFAGPLLFICCLILGEAVLCGGFFIGAVIAFIFGGGSFSTSGAIAGFLRTGGIIGAASSLPVVLALKGGKDSSLSFGAVFGAIGGAIIGLLFYLFSEGSIGAVFYNISGGAFLGALSFAVLGAATDGIFGIITGGTVIDRRA